MLGLVEDAMVLLAHVARRREAVRLRRKRGATLRPGPDTMLWLALAARIRPHLRSYGAKSRLAVELGLDPSRISEFFVTRTAMPDAERTLRLLVWL
jgi:hypothetical protein